MRVLVAGVSTRAQAESAARAGHEVTAIDAFADLDQHPAVAAKSIVRHFGLRFSATAIARASRTVDCDAVAYGSSFENHPRAVSELARGRTLLGNSPAVLRRVRDPRQLSEALAARGLPSLAVRHRQDSGATFRRPAPGSNWILKPLHSGGGRRTRLWRDGMTVPRNCYLQEFVDGEPGSVVFVANGQRASVLGVTRQLIGEAAFGAHGFHYCGSILRRIELPGGVRAVADAVVEEFSLVGVGGIDFIGRGNAALVIEVNPRWSASMELVERASGVSMFGAHERACRDGSLASSTNVPGSVAGKAIVFAPESVTIGEGASREWLADRDVRDVPRPGERIRQGQPICTVFASAATEDVCHDRLVTAAARVYAALGVSHTAATA